MDNIEIPWLRPLTDAWRRAADRGRPAQAILLTGSVGVGKRAAAAWIAAERLGLGTAGSVPVYRSGAAEDDETGHATFQQLPDHPDLHWVRPPFGKRNILIEQVRELVHELGLTSHDGGAKVAILEPANLMISNAAASLLKTLEEPPGDTLLVLVADRVGRLPPTILSRCQRLAVTTPAEAVSLEWLNRIQPAANWPAALRMAGGAPLEAIRIRERLDVIAAMARDFSQVAERRASPIDVAGRWCELETDFVLEWLARQVQQGIHRVSGSAGDRYESDIAESVLSRIDRRNLFCYLDDINRVRRQSAGSFNVQLTLESLLIDWAEGLRNCCNKMIRGGLLPIPGGKVNA